MEKTLDLQPLLDLLRHSPSEIQRLALTDAFLRDEIVFADGRFAALVVTFNEEQLDEARATILDEIYRTVRSQLPPGLSTYFLLLGLLSLATSDILAVRRFGIGFAVPAVQGDCTAVLTHRASCRI